MYIPPQSQKKQTKTEPAYTTVQIGEYQIRATPKITTHINLCPNITTHLYNGKTSIFFIPIPVLFQQNLLPNLFFSKIFVSSVFFSGSFSHSRLWDKCIHCLSRSFHAHRSRQCNCWHFQPERKGRWMALVGGTSSSFFGWLHTSLFKTGGEDL